MKSFDDTDLSVVVHGECDVGVVAPVDETDSCPVHTDVQLVHDGDDRLFDPAEPRSSDASGTVQNEHQVHQPAAACKQYEQGSTAIWQKVALSPRSQSARKVENPESRRHPPFKSASFRGELDPSNTWLLGRHE